MKLLIDLKYNTKEIINFYNDLSLKEKTEIEVDDSVNFNELLKDNIVFLCKYNVSKYYIDDKNKLKQISSIDILNLHKKNKVEQLYIKATLYIEKTYKPIKQLIASLGLYESTKINEIKDCTIKIKGLIDKAEAEILQLKTIEEIDNYNINIF